MKKRILILMMLFSILPVSFANGYDLTYFYSTFTQSQIENNYDSVVNLRPTIYENLREENSSCNFYGIDMINESNSFPGSFVCTNSSVFVDEVVDINNNTYNSSIFRSNQTGCTSYFDYKFYPTMHDVAETELFVEYEMIIRVNFSTFEMRIYYMNRKTEFYFNLSNFHGYGVNFVNEWTYFHLAYNATSNTGHGKAIMLSNSSNEFNFTHNSSSAIAVPSTFLLFYSPLTGMVDWSALNSDLMFTNSLDDSPANYTLYNTNYQNQTILDLYNPLDKGYILFDINYTNSSYFEPFNTTYTTDVPFPNALENLTLVNYTLVESNTSTIPYSILLNSANITENTVIYPLVKDLNYQAFVFKLYMNYDSISLRNRSAGSTAENIYILNNNDYIWDYYDSDGLMDSFTAFETNITVVFEVYANDNYTNVYSPELGVYYQYLDMNVNDTMNFFVSPNSDYGIQFASYYNSSIPFNNSFTWGYDTFTYTNSTQLNSSTVKFYQFLYANISVENNDSSYFDYEYNISMSLANDYSNISYYNSSNEPLVVSNTTFYNDTNTTYSMSRLFQLDYNITEVHYSNITDYNYHHNITFNVIFWFSAYISVENPTILNLLIGFVPPILIFILFPMAFKKKGFWFMMIGFMIGFIVLGTSGIITTLQSIILSLITLISFTSFSYVVNRRSEHID